MTLVHQVHSPGGDASRGGDDDRDHHLAVGVVLHLRNAIDDIDGKGHPDDRPEREDDEDHSFWRRSVIHVAEADDQDRRHDVGEDHESSRDGLLDLPDQFQGCDDVQDLVDRDEPDHLGAFFSFGTPNNCTVACSLYCW